MTSRRNTMPVRNQNEWVASMLAINARRKTEPGVLSCATSGHVSPRPTCTFSSACVGAPELAAAVVAAGAAEWPLTDSSRRPDSATN